MCAWWCECGPGFADGFFVGVVCGALFADVVEAGLGGEGGLVVDE
jgi:hypothetical protein